MHNVGYLNYCVTKKPNMKVRVSSYFKQLKVTQLILLGNIITEQSLFK